MKRAAFLLVATITWVGLVSASDEHSHAEEGVAPAEAWKKLEEGNARYAANKPEHAHQDAARRTETAKGQKPFAAVLACADSRVGPELVFDQGLGDLFVVRVAGNVVDDTALASLEYAVKHLGVKLIVVLGHSKCGAVDAAVKQVKEDSHLGKLTGLIKEAVEQSKKWSGDAVQNAVSANALLTAQRLKKSGPVLKKSVKDGQLQIVPAVYDIESGAVKKAEEPKQPAEKK
ncbi:MAG: carbonic anhydrase [Planctomycetes bacterium]|nr:carbonic anhydrase [Planctomycetota bacterium]